MSTFSKTIAVTSEHIDELQHINNVVYLQLVQEIAGEHWKILSERITENNYAWVVLRHEIDYKGQAKLGDKVLITTWVGETGGFKSVRYVNFTLNDKIIASAKTTWCLLDAVTLKPKRITEEFLQALER